ncbi:MAG: 2-oxoacid:acceptor oxidoreductase family protein [Candidatus Methanofastidiosia archaeon]
MIEIRFHGRGGQGSVIGAEILAETAFREGKFVQAFPYFGVERRGAPVTAYTRIDDKEIRIRSNIYCPNHVVVLDPTLLDVVDVTEGLHKEGWIVINTSKKPSDIDINHEKIATVDATRIARKYGLGSKTAPIVNTSILGAVTRVTGVVKLKTLVETTKNRVPAKRDENALAAKEAYENVVAGG